MYCTALKMSVDNADGVIEVDDAADKVEGGKRCNYWVSDQTTAQMQSSAKSPKRR
jgi:hypothetical protein